MFSFLPGFIWLALCLWNSSTSLHKLVVLQFFCSIWIDIWLLRKRQGCYEHFSTYLLVYVCAAFSWLKPRQGIVGSWRGYRFSFVHIIDSKLDREIVRQQVCGIAHLPWPSLVLDPALVTIPPVPSPFNPRAAIASFCCSCCWGHIIPVSPFTLPTAVNSLFFKFFPVKSFQFHCTPPGFLTPAMFWALSLELG